MQKTNEQLGLEYPQIKADIDLCYEYLFEICRGERKKSILSTPPNPEDFDIQFSAALDELKSHRQREMQEAYRP